MSRIEDIRARLDRYWSDDTAAFVAHAPSDVEDLLAVAEAAEAIYRGRTLVGPIVHVQRTKIDTLGAALARLDAATGGER